MLFRFFIVLFLARGVPVKTPVSSIGSSKSYGTEKAKIIGDLIVSEGRVGHLRRQCLNQAEWERQKDRPSSHLFPYGYKLPSIWTAISDTEWQKLKDAGKVWSEPTWLYGECYKGNPGHCFNDNFICALNGIHNYFSKGRPEGDFLFHSLYDFYDVREKKPAFDFCTELLHNAGLVNVNKTVDHKYTCFEDVFFARARTFHSKADDNEKSCQVDHDKDAFLHKHILTRRFGAKGAEPLPPPKNKKLGTLVFMSRDDRNQARHLQNSSKIWANLQRRLGGMFENMVEYNNAALRKLGSKKQAELLHNASMLVTIHGGQFWSLLYARPGLPVLELVPRGCEWFFIEMVGQLQSVAKGFGWKHYYMVDEYKMRSKNRNINSCKRGSLVIYEDDLYQKIVTMYNDFVR